MEQIENVTGDVLDLNNQFTSYEDYKAAVDTEMNRAAESFVRIGYLLKLARDTDILKESGYANVNEFAEAAYHLDKSQVSRFININDEFAENGYSDRLKEHYRGYGYAKLALMLTLPEEIREEIPQSYSKSEIRTLQEEYKEEQKVSDIEVMLEGEKESQEELPLIGKVMDQLFHDHPELAAGIADVSVGEKKEYYEALAPGEEITYTVRVQGVGRLVLIIKGEETDLLLMNMRSMEKECVTWDELMAAVSRVFCDWTEDETAKEWWEKHYREPYQVKEEKVAPVQPQKSEKPQKDSARKPSKVVTPPKKKEPEKVKPDPVTKTEESVIKPEEIVPKQEEIVPKQEETAPESEDEESAPAAVHEQEDDQKVHHIKVWADFFDAVAAGDKTFELRKNDRDYKTGDILEMMEFKDGKYTGRTVRVVVTYLLTGFEGLEDGYCIMATSLLSERGEPLDRADLNQICADIRANAEGCIECDGEYITIESAIEIIAGGKIE